MRLSLIVGLSFSWTGSNWTWAALGSKARAARPEPSPRGCRPNNWCGERCRTSTRDLSSSWVKTIVGATYQRQTRMHLEKCEHSGLVKNLRLRFADEPKTISSSFSLFLSCAVGWRRREKLHAGDDREVA